MCVFGVAIQPLDVHMQNTDVVEYSGINKTSNGDKKQKKTYSTLQRLEIRTKDLDVLLISENKGIKTIPVHRCSSEER
mgnify:CR=1 FL=1